MHKRKHHLINFKYAKLDLRSKHVTELTELLGGALEHSAIRIINEALSLHPLCKLAL